MGVGSIGHGHQARVQRSQGAGGGGGDETAKADKAEGGGGKADKGAAAQGAEGVEELGSAKGGGKGEKADKGDKADKRGKAGKGDEAGDKVEGGGGAEKCAKGGGADEAEEAEGDDEAKESGKGGGAGKADKGGKAEDADEAGEDEGDDDDAAGGGGAVAGGGGAGAGGCGMKNAATAVSQLGSTPAAMAGMTMTDPSTATMLAGAMAAPQPVAAAPAPAPAAPTAAASGSGAKLVGQAAQQFQGSTIAQQVLTSLDAAGAKVELVADAEFAAAYGATTAGVFDPKTDTISISQSTAKDPNLMKLVMVHEGAHWLQDNVQGGLAALGGSVTQALQSANAVQPGTANTSHHLEAQAYLVEALAANEAGVKASGIGGAANGAANSYSQILGEIQKTPEYA